MSKFSVLADKACRHIMTPEERAEQRANMIVGLSGDDSKVTYESAKKYVNEKYGRKLNANRNE